MRTGKKESAFTLIELLVVIAILGILAALAISQFSEFRRRGFDTRAKSDLRAVASAEEAYFADSGRYLSCVLANGVGTCQTLPGLGVMSAGVNLAIVNNADTTFTGTANHPLGTGITFNWDSANGGLQ